jgi:hypothetical protein
VPLGYLPAATIGVSHRLPERQVPRQETVALAGPMVNAGRRDVPPVRGSGRQHPGRETRRGAANRTPLAPRIDGRAGGANLPRFDCAPLPLFLARGDNGCGLRLLRFHDQRGATLYAALPGMAEHRVCGPDSSQQA